jgi:hypothetical protein
MRKNIASQKVSAQLTSKTDGSAVTTGTTNIFVTKDGGTQTAGLGTITHKGNGLWEYLPTQAETNADYIVFTFSNTSAVIASPQVYTISFDPHNVTSLGLTNLDTTVSSRSTFNPTTDTVANVTTVATTTSVTNDVGITQGAADKVWDTTTRALTDKANFTIAGTKTTLDALNDIAATAVVSNGAITTLAGAVVNVDLVDVTTTNTDMRGTDNALLASGYTAPDNASITSILADTNELQTNQGNWLTATGFSTHSAADVWTSVTRSLTDKANFTISGTKTTLDSLNDFNATSDAVATVTNLTNLPTAPANWITASSIAASALNGKGDWNIGKTGYSLTQAFPANFSSMSIDVSGNTNSFVQGYLSTALTETTSGRIANNFDTFFENGDAVATKVVNDVGTAVSGGGEFTATEKNQIRFRLGLDGTTAAPTATPDIAQKSDITALHNFNPATDTVARVTLVDTTTTNTDMVSAAPSVASIADAVWDEAQSGHTTVGTFGSFLDAKVSAAGGGGGASAADIWSYATRELTSSNNIVLAKGTGVTGFNDIAATDIVTGGAITTSGGAVSNVTLVNTTTTNSDMRGTNSAMLASSYIAPDNASIASILVDTGTTIPAQISGLNDLSAADVWTTQLTESYAADGVAPTATEALMLTQQFLSDFNITGTSYNVNKLDGTTAAATFTLNDSANPTSITRS